MIRALVALAICALSFLASPSFAIEVTPIDSKIHVVELSALGDNVEAAKKQAQVDAVKAAAGRVLLGDRLIMADELLDKYLSNYAENFVSALEVLDTEFFEGRNRVKARVFVNYANLVSDLDEKRFVFKPEYKPQFATFMTERLDGRISSDGVARSALGKALNDLGMRPYSGQLATPPSTTDVSIDDFLLDAAVISSQRGGVEVIVTGEAVTRLREPKKLYFDEYFFYESDMSAKMIRVDTGEVLFEAKGFGSAAGKTEQEAQQQAIERAAVQVAAGLTEEFDGFWPVVVQGRADYQILLTGVDDELLAIVMQNIKRLGSEAQVFVRKSFDKSTVISVVYPGEKQDLLDNLNSCPYPALNILNPDAESNLEVQVSG